MSDELIVFAIRLIFAIYCLILLSFFSIKAMDLKGYLKVKDYIGILTLILISLALILDSYFYDPEYWYGPAETLINIGMVCLLTYCVLGLVYIIKSKSEIKGYIPFIIIIATLTINYLIPYEIYYDNYALFTIITYTGHFLWSFALLYGILLELSEREIQERKEAILNKQKIGEKDFISEDINITHEKAKFHVIKPKPINWVVLAGLILISFLGLIPMFSILLYFLIPVFILIGIITPILWNKLGKSISNKLVIKGFQIWQENKIINPLRSLSNLIFGLKFSAKLNYFLQGEARDLDLNNINQFLKEKIFDIVSACIGITFTLATILRLTSVYPDTENGRIDLLGTVLLILIISPILISWLIPLIWTVKDGHIRAIDEKHIINDIGEKMNRSLLSRILGITGIALGLSFLLDFFGDEYDILYRYSMAVFYLIIFTILIIGLSFLLGMIYLLIYHEKRVNEFRSKLAKIPLPIGITIIRQAAHTERQFLLDL